MLQYPTNLQDDPLQKSQLPLIAITRGMALHILPNRPAMLHQRHGQPLITAIPIFLRNVKYILSKLLQTPLSVPDLKLPRPILLYILNQIEKVEHFLTQKVELLAVEE